ncbi:1-acyl-sn-glycerol-3-phosphate acyltransferase [Phycicoccus sp. MAQZ13P-2]|uniref:lysophospholipid acyltransferase family protein n=1 Tax=Phycicoccus mangrovi TaxID=2840470 RepID=UPI001C007952|nr:lysophospholipid acyltransferase family protein [Phycicoccus mangrovi]MBT9254318.1 1-acyl-sn-glycerol-3-phosphate acyltransferase [Phycicoccus mangrovi]MBT9272696.1 1-acyl-sn-glycerol-3-phosphate acyltransferase [Phycicoccus mangrovi]
MTTPTDSSRPFGYRFAIAVLRPIFRALTRRRWEGVEHLPTTGGWVVCPNHVSHVDPLAFAHFLVDQGYSPRFLGKDEVFRVPVVGAVLRSADQIPVHRESGSAVDAYRAAVAAVRANKCVAIYPEGTLTRDPGLWPMRGKTGAARVALETRCPVVPVAVWGPQEMLPPYARVPRLLPRPVMRVRAGRPVDLADLYDLPVTAEVLAEATRRIMAAITTELEVLRGEPAPAERFDPRRARVTPTGRPRPIEEAS